MNMFTASVRCATALALVLASATIASAQNEERIDPEWGYRYDSTDDTYTPPPKSAVMQAFESQFAWKVIDYWNTQLNAYKSRIDRTVAPCDLAELNRLRVYWSIFIDEKKWEGLAEGVDGIFGTGFGGSSNTYNYRATDTVIYAYPADDPDYVEYYEENGYDGDDGNTAPMTVESPATAEIAAEVATAYPADGPWEAPSYALGSADASDTPAAYSDEYSGLSLATPSDGDEEAELKEVLVFVDRISEMAETFFVAKWIARRYRPEFDKIRDDISADTRRCIDTLLLFKENFQRQHAAAIAADPEATRVMEEFTRDQADIMFAELGSEKTFMMIYNVVIEPFLLLYNGQDFRKLLKEVDALPREISGIALPEMSALRQNVPNPAAITTTIPYVLDEPSNGTTLRLYNSRGDLMQQKELGFRSSGEHTADLDVSKLPPGSYLYHLTVQGTRGERVYSKTMQVVR